MKQLLEKVYFNLLSQNTKQSYWLSKILEFVLFPELRPNNLRKHLKITIYFIIGYIFMATLVSNTILIYDIKEERNISTLYRKQINYLYDNADKVVYNRCLDSLKRSKEYIRFIIYQESGVVVPKTVPESHLRLIIWYAELKGIPLSIYVKVIQQESGFDSTALSNKSAHGYMQMMPITFKEYYNCLNLKGGNTAANNLICGAEMLKQKYEYWYNKSHNKKEAWRMTLACYAMGDLVPKSCGKVPPIVESYVNNILRNEKFK